jgi:multimeric flavodoxin WrbA
MVNECGEKLAAACGVVLGSPVYYGGVAGTFKCFLDRLFFSQADLRGKAGAVAVSLRRSGGISTFHQLNNYLNLAQAVLTPSLYWDVFHGNNADEAGEDAEGMHIMETTGRNMAWLIKSLAEAKKSIPLPESKPRIMTNFIR